MLTTHGHVHLARIPKEKRAAGARMAIKELKELMESNHS
jgi:hypothetical protein